MDRETLKSRVRAHLTENNVHGNEFGDDDDIFETGVLDSLAFADFLGFLDEEFSVVVERHDLDIEDFQSVDRIVAFLASRV